MFLVRLPQAGRLLITGLRVLRHSENLIGASVVTNRITLHWAAAILHGNHQPIPLPLIRLSKSSKALAKNHYGQTR